MSVKAYTNSGAENCSKLEKVADLFLAIPRALWFGYSVRVIKGVPTHKRSDYITSEDQRLRKPCDISAVGGLIALCYSPTNDFAFLQKLSGAILFGAIFVVASLAATPLLAIGCALKKVALKDPKALHYHKFAKLFLEKEELNEAVSDKTRQHNALLGQLRMTHDYTFRVLDADERRNNPTNVEEENDRWDRIAKKVEKIWQADKRFIKSNEALSSLKSRLDEVSTEYVKAMEAINK